MNKIRKFLIYPILALSCAIFLTFSTILIVLNVKSYSKGTYSCSLNMFYIFSVKMDLTLDKNGTGTMTTVTSSMFDEEGPSTETSTFEFYVKSGSLYIKNDEYPDFQEIGKINAFKFEMQDPEETEGEAYTFTLKNNSAIKLQKTSITLMIVFASTAALCGAYLIVEKIIAKKKSKTNTLETENLDESLQPTEIQE